MSRTERAINELRTLLQGDAPEGWRPEGRLRMVPLFVPISFDHRVARLETAIEPLQRLLRGELTTSRSEWLQLTDASIAVTSSSPPPIWIAAEGPRMLALAARCDGWNHAYWGAYDTGRFRVAAARLQEAIERAGRSREEVEASASIACVLDGWTEVPGGFREEEVAVGSAGDLARLVGDYADAGADHVILSLSPDPHAELDASALEKSREILEQL